ncbi:MAG: hypothetical protein MRERC_15c007 [Mycoplasmataceae bacterium RC_NB112A]|nr:MAG: hypothetical protein MRERC_15c007 [Mycoplasmataceae bacterium RC_NB112A]
MTKFPNKIGNQFLKNFFVENPIFRNSQLRDKEKKR